MKTFIILLLTLLPLFAHTNFPQTHSLNGVWNYHIQQEPEAENYYYDFKETDKTMNLPANWYKAGINHGGIVWFNRTFSMNELPISAHHFLEFHGVDYLCDIWVNNRYVGSHKGYFQTFDFDISSHVKRGENSITIKVNSPLENYPEHYSLHKTLLRGIFAHHDTRPGGAWSAEGQDKNSGGIWNDVFIKSYGDYKVEKLKITPEIAKDKRAIDVAFKLNTLSKGFSIFNRDSVMVTVTPSNFKGEAYSQSYALNSSHEIQQFKMVLPHAKLWQTHDRGFPYLYDVTLTIGKTKVTQQIGLKSLVQNKKEQFVLNGQALFVKGTNYISSQYLSEMDTNALKADLKLMKEAHINTIRVHAHIEPERFYTLCDEMGFLVWQDYNLQWGYLESEAFTKEAVKQAIEMVDTFYNHPSIFMWSMHNEPPWNSDWMKWKYADYNASQNKALDEALYSTIKVYDTYHLTKKLSSNLEHPWFGWYSGKYQDFAKPSKVAVVSEYGAQALPNIDSLRKILPNKYLVPNGDKAKKEWEYHNFQFDRNKAYGIEFKSDLKTFIKDSQTYQADLIKFATEMLRIQKYHHTTGIFQFMFNEGWPSMNWGIVDYYRHIKPGYTALKEAYAPIIVVAKQMDDNTIELYVVNDTLEDISNAKLIVNITQKYQEKELGTPVSIKADSVRRIGSILLNEDASLFELRLEVNNKVVTKNKYNFERRETTP